MGVRLFFVKERRFGESIYEETENSCCLFAGVPAHQLPCDYRILFFGLLLVNRL